ncbi:hypothetical protein NC652_004694 [Populus alba x Populus x berolinensis]|nr:hypothetical protein NC652_004694 [Populus alba x Populus x berolinensis]
MCNRNRATDLDFSFATETEIVKVKCEEHYLGHNVSSSTEKGVHGSRSVADGRDLHLDTHTGDGLCERMERVYCGCVSHTVKSKGEGLIFCFGQLWRRRAQCGRRDGRAGIWMLGLINFFGKVKCVFSEQQPRQKQLLVAFAYPAFRTQL